MVGRFRVEILGRLGAKGAVPWIGIGRLDAVNAVDRPWSVGLEGKPVVEALQGNLVVEGAVEPIGTGRLGAVDAIGRPWSVGLQGRPVVEALQGSLVVEGRCVEGVVGGEEPIIIGSLDDEGAEAWEALGGDSRGDRL